MKHARIALAAAGLLAGAAWAQAPLGTHFTYQGRLDNGLAPANGSHDMQFKLFDAGLGGAQVGSTICVDNVGVTDGLFMVQIDFGASPFVGDARWLEVGVRMDATVGNCTAGAYTTLAPRQMLTAAPYALFALNAPSTTGFWSANGTHIFKSNSGNVGINTNAPARPLEIRSSMRVANVQSGPLVANAPSVLEMKSNAVGLEHPYGSLRFLDGNDVVAGSIECGLGPNIFGADEGMRFATEGLTRMTISPAGNVGIGTTDPAEELHVVGRIYAEGGGWSIRGLKQGNGTFPGVWGETESVSSGASGVRGFVLSTTPGADSAGIWGRNAGTNNNGYGVRGNHEGGGVGVIGISVSGTGVRGYSNAAGGYGGSFGDLATPGKGVLVVGESHLLSPVGIGTTTVPAGVMLMVEGTAQVDILKIAGADVAEKFLTSEAAETIEPGTVMEIDPDSAGKLRISRGAYNRRVAGVVSGAGDIPVGAILGNLPGHEDAPPIALSGRVWVKCDASQHAIDPGDLLTTAAAAGHASKVIDHAAATGATIGKAMSSLRQGETGLVLVLVNLQ